MVGGTLAQKKINTVYKLTNQENDQNRKLKMKASQPSNKPFVTSPLLTQNIYYEVLFCAASDVDGFTAVAACVCCGSLEQSQGFSHLKNLDVVSSNHLSFRIDVCNQTHYFLRNNLSYSLGNAP